MSDRANPRELTTDELSARAQSYMILAKDVAPTETREIFERLATLYVRLATERKAAEKAMTRH